MNINKIHTVFLIGVFLLLNTLKVVAGLNLLSNGSFEEHTCSSLGCSFDYWSMPLGCGNLNADDMIDGDVSLQFGPMSITSVLDNAVSLPDYYYAPGTEFKITICFKILTITKTSSLELDCYWEPEANGDAETMRLHDAEVLQGAFATVGSSEWQVLEVTTTKPLGSTRLRVRVKTPQKSVTLFDAFRVEEIGEKPGEAYIHISPIKVAPVTTTLGNPVDFTTLHVEQANITGTTTFEISGYDPEMFHLSTTSMPSETGELDLIITYAPTKAGTHTAILNIDNLNHTSLFKSVQLTGICIDPTQKPSITVIPTSLPQFMAVAGNEQRDTFTVISENCKDFVYLTVEHIKGDAFTIDGSMSGKNATNTFQVRFAPLDSGEFQSKVIIHSEGVDSVVISLNGVGIKKDETNIDWLTNFKWDDSKPLTLMNETFDNVEHNKTLVLDGWQNIAAIDQRPWWGFDEAKTVPQRGTERYAKATAYQYGKEETKDWEMILITPALDYKNSEGKIFAFSVMGEYMPDVDNLALLEIYYVEQIDGKAYFQDLTESFVFPTTGDENGVWRTFFLNLEPYAETIADVFYIAFRYTSPNGSSGAVTYYIDNVSWGRTDLPEIRVKPTVIIDSTAVVGQEKVLAEVEVTGRNLTDDILLGVGGANYNRFDVSPTFLPPEGGTFKVLFKGQDVGVHEAYIVLSSKGSADAFIPISVLCNNSTRIEDTYIEKKDCTKFIKDGHLYLKYSGKVYDPIGKRVK